MNLYLSIIFTLVLSGMTVGLLVHASEKLQLGRSTLNKKVFALTTFILIMLPMCVLHLYLIGNDKNYDKDNHWPHNSYLEYTN